MIVVSVCARLFRTSDVFEGSLLNESTACTFFVFVNHNKLYLKLEALMPLIGENSMAFHISCYGTTA